MRVVHIGFPKTATTLLQRCVFPRLSERFDYVGPERCAALFKPVIHHDDTIFDARRVKEQLAQVWRPGRPVLFSYEPLTGLHHRSGFVNRTTIARRLKYLGFDRVIVTIRNQLDALESAYKQYVKSGGVLRFHDYVRFDQDDRLPYLFPEYFAYDGIYGLYAALFGPSNVLVLQQERLREPGFLSDLGAFLGLPSLELDLTSAVNASLSYDKTRILRVLNHFCYSDYQPSHLISRRISSRFFYRLLARMPVLDRPRSFLDAGTRTAAARFYATSNEQLRQQAGIALTSDYPLPDTASPQQHAARA